MKCNVLQSEVDSFAISKAFRLGVYGKSLLEKQRAEESFMHQAFAATSTFISRLSTLSLKPS